MAQGTAGLSYEGYEGAALFREAVKTGSKVS